MYLQLHIQRLKLQQNTRRLRGAWNRMRVDQQEGDDLIPNVFRFHIAQPLTIRHQLKRRPAESHSYVTPPFWHDVFSFLVAVCLNSSAGVMQGRQNHFFPTLTLGFRVFTVPRLPPPESCGEGGGAVLAFGGPPQAAQTYTFHGFRVFYPPSPYQGGDLLSFLLRNITREKKKTEQRLRR